MWVANVWLSLVEGTTGYEFHCTLGDSISVYEKLGEAASQVAGKDIALGRWGGG